MAWRVAVSSVDDVLINQHFGHARWFYIRDIARDGTSISLGRRMTEPFCGGGAPQDHGAETGFEVLKDCAAVLTAKIGPPMRQRLEAAGISVFEEPAAIDEAVKKLAAYYGRTNRPENA
jgi:predicted Fe-Mo cluster-binding NifX family protein